MKYKVLLAGLGLFLFLLSPVSAYALGSCCVITVDDDEVAGGAGFLVVTITSTISGVTVCAPVPVPLAATDDVTSAAVFAELTGPCGITAAPVTDTTCIATLGPAGVGDEITDCSIAGAPAPTSTRAGTQFVSTPGQTEFDVFDVDYLATGPAGDVEGAGGGALTVPGGGATLATACVGAVAIDPVGGLTDTGTGTAFAAATGGVQTPATVGAGLLPSVVITAPAPTCSATAVAGDPDQGLDVLWAGGAGPGDLIANFVKNAVPALSAFGMVAFLLLATGGYFIRKRRARI